MGMERKEAMKLIFVVFALLLQSCSYDNYNDCLIKELKGNSERVTAVLVERACRGKYPDTAPPEN